MGTQINVDLTDGAPIAAEVGSRGALRRVASESHSTSRLSREVGYKLYPYKFSELYSNTSRKERWFRDRLRERDGRCAITGAATPDYAGLEACHIFPRSRENTWIENRYGSRWITDTTDAYLIGASKMFSLQNGLLLNAFVHRTFDLYQWAVSPNVGF